MSKRILSLFAAVMLAGALNSGAQAIDSFPRTTTIQPSDLLLTQTNSTGQAGQKFTRSITWSNVLESLMDFPNWTGGSGSVDPTNAVLANIIGTGAITNASSRDFYATNGNLYSKNLSLNHRWVYYDDFNQPMTTPGVFPDSPTGHKYNVFTGGGGNTNLINLVDGKWWMGGTGAVYQSVTFGTNGVYGSAAPINTWGGTFSYQRSTNNTPDGYEQNLFLILSPQVDFLPTNYLHITIGANIFRVQRELSATNIIYAQHFGGRYLAFDTNHSFTVTIVSNNIICDIAGMRYVGYDESLSTTYGNVKVATWEAIGSPTNQFWAKWDSQYAGYSDNEAHWQYAGPFAVRSNGVLSRVTSTNFTLSVDDAYASGWNGSLDVPSKNAIYDKIETLGSGGGGTNFAGIIVSNGLERTVLWTSTTNLSLSWNAANEVIWSPVGVTASLAMTGTPGNGTNAQVINLKLRLTDSGTTSVTFPTNGTDGLAPFVLTAPSTNEYALIYDGQTFRIASYQSPSTGSGQVLVVNTNPVIWNPTIGINGASNVFTFSTPSANQVLSVHASSGGITTWTNTAPTGGGNTNLAVLATGVLDATNQIKHGSVTYSNSWQIAQEGSRSSKSATAKDGSANIDTHGLAAFVATGTAAASSGTVSNESRVIAYSAASANADAGHEVNFPHVRPGKNNRLHGTVNLISTTNELRMWWAFSDDALTSLSDRDMPTSKNVVGLRYNSNTNSNWWFVTSNGSSATNVDTGVPLTGEHYRARISFVETVTATTTNWVAYINGLPVATNTALLPVARMKFVGGLRTFNAASKTNAFEFLNQTSEP